MRKHSIAKLLSFLLLLSSACGATNQTEAGYPARQQESMALPTRGTATVDELAQAVYGAIQAANIGAMDPYFLTEAELAALKERGTPALEAVLQNLDPEQIMAQFKEDYQRLVDASMTRRINWAETSLTDFTSQPPADEERRVFPVELVLSDRTNQQFKVVFEAVELDGRYFLFRRIGFA